MAAIYYPAIIDRSASGFGVSFPDFPGCIAAGETLQDAATSAEAALSLHIEGMREDGDALPAPSALDDIEPVEGVEIVATVLVRATAEAKFQRVQITLEESLLNAIDAVSPNRSAFLAESARTALRVRNSAKPSYPDDSVMERWVAAAEKAGLIQPLRERVG